MKYFKFNNSRSTKYPFFVYVKVDGYDIEDATGNNWVRVPPGSIEITYEEFNKVEQSSMDTSILQIGDKIVYLEFVSVKERYGIVKTLVDGDAKLRMPYRVILEDGRNLLLRDVRKENFIHTI